MTTKLLVPILLLAACGDNLHPDDTDDQSSFGSEEDTGGHDTPAREIDASIFIETITCVETIARFEAGARYIDGTPVTDFECLWTFDDGTTSTECVGEHPFAEAGFHDFELEVTDVTTGARDTVTQTRFFFPPLEATLEVTGDDFALTWNAMSNTGGEQIVTVSPAELVIADDPDYQRRLHYTVQVAQPGTYTVEYSVEDERGVSEICQARVVREITLVCDGAGHVH